MYRVSSWNGRRSEIDISTLAGCLVGRRKKMRVKIDEVDWEGWFELAESCMTEGQVTETNMGPT